MFSEHIQGPPWIIYQEASKFTEPLFQVKDVPWNARLWDGVARDWEANKRGWLYAPTRTQPLCLLCKLIHQFDQDLDSCSGMETNKKRIVLGTIIISATYYTSPLPTTDYFGSTVSATIPRRV